MAEMLERCRGLELQILSSDRNHIQDINKYKANESNLLFDLKNSESLNKRLEVKYEAVTGLYKY